MTQTKWLAGLGAHPIRGRGLRARSDAVQGWPGAAERRRHCGEQPGPARVLGEHLRRLRQADVPVGLHLKKHLKTRLPMLRGAAKKTNGALYSQPHTS